MTTCKRLAIVLAIVAMPCVARADRATAERFFDEGKTLANEGRCAAAVVAFERSVEAEASTGALLNLGECEERLGRLLTALRTFERAEQLARPTDQVRAEEAQRRQLNIEARIPSVRVRVAERSSSVRIDGNAIAVGEIVRLDPGVHALEATAAGRKRHSASFSLREGEKEKELAVPALREDAPPAPVAAATKSTPWPWILGGAGVAALGFGGASGLVAISAKKDVDGLCPHYPGCPAGSFAEAAAAEDRARTWSTLATVSVSVGIALVGAAIVWLVVDRAPANAAGSLRSFAF